MAIETPVTEAQSALEPLFEPWEEPRSHRVRNLEPGKPALIVPHRRPSPIAIVQNLRAEIRQWRESFYIGTSETTFRLLKHWFARPHRMKTAAGDEYEFRYYFCQREAIETLIYLKEVRRIDCLSQLVSEFGGADREIAELGITAEEDTWARYAFKLATGAGKTKCMSLAMVWSYFHALRESDSQMARHFVVIAPNLTVYERLKDDFAGGKIFDTDPLIPAEWRGDWNLSVVLQDEAGGAATGGVLYLTNIHRLYDNSEKGKRDAETYGFMGPAVSKSKALDTGALLRDRITSHKRLMVFNDEAHHVWDPDSAWNEAIGFLHESTHARTGAGLVAQLDFSATPKDNRGQPFKHIVCDTPLGEAVDGGIVKTPIIGSAGDSLHEEPSDNAAFCFDRHLRLGYERWNRSRVEWEKSGKKALMFVMCEDTKAADQIAQRLNTDEIFKHLNGKTINLHTNLKGRVKTVGRGAGARKEFVESDRDITDEDLKALRELSRSLDDNTTPYRCIVSVLMLREGWDVRNVTTIVPLRPYTAQAAILPEQTLGRGLRRMTPPGGQGAAELVSVVEHPMFAALYKEQLAQEGVAIDSVDVEHIPATTISIYPDEARKDFKVLEIVLPGLSQAHRIVPTLQGLTLEDVKKAFARYKPLPLGRAAKPEIDYEGKHLFTGEVVERMRIHLPLLGTGFGAVSYYVQQIEQVCKLRNLHPALGTLMQTFLEEMLFSEKTSLSDERLIVRLSDSDVAEHIRAVFVPLVRSRTITAEKRSVVGPLTKLSGWKPYQVTHSETHPALEAKNTLFNLVPCNRALEQVVTKFVDRANDTAAFAKNAGPQCLRIDYLGHAGNLAFYTPDFFVRTKSGKHYIVETKGKEDLDVPKKAKAAIAWCESASSKDCLWEYLYIPQGVFQRMKGSTIEELVSTCRPALRNLLESDENAATPSLFGSTFAEADERKSESPLVSSDVLNDLPPRYRHAAEQATTLFRFMEGKPGNNYAAAFTGLLGPLDDAARELIVRRLVPAMPKDAASQQAWFAVYLPYGTDAGTQKRYEQTALNLKKTMVFKSGTMPIGLLRTCLDFALNGRVKPGGVFESVSKAFKVDGARKILQQVQQVYDFRNTYVAHQQQELKDPGLAQRNIILWINTLRMLAAETGQLSGKPPTGG